MKIRNRTLKKEIVDELNMLEERCFTFDKPVPFKDKLMLYPVTVEHYNEFLVCSACCTLNKNDSTEGLTMTHLDYLVSKMESGEGGQMWAMQFSRLVELVFHIQNGVRCKGCGTVYSFKEFLEIIEKDKEKACCPKCQGTDIEEIITYKTDPKTQRRQLVIDGVTITSKDFDRFRQIVLYQNLPDYQDDSWVDPEVREDQRLKNELLSKSRSNPTASLEKKIVCVSAKSTYKIEELYTMSIRKFLMLLTAIDDAITYQADRMGLMTGMVSTKKPLEHWIYKSEKSMYGEAVTADAYTSKINSTGGQ